MKKLLIVVGSLGLAAVLWYSVSLSPVSEGSPNRVSVKIPSGSSTTQISQLLYEKGLIRSAFAFKLYIRLNSEDGTLQAGTFIFQQSQSAAEIVDLLHAGRGQEIPVTIPEGFTVSDIDALLAEIELIEPGEIVRCANECDFSSFEFLPDSKGLAERGGVVEGYLFPDTYFIEVEEFVAKFFLERLMTTFRNNVLEDLESEFASTKYSLHEIITMASLIEKETRTDDERVIVSDILWKRFEDSRGLGVDATVRYILSKPTEGITHGDLNNNSPYNTRKFRGLPPGPIANVGLKSIEATLNPEESPYWYYLHDNEGLIHYAVSNEEHNMNRVNYLGSGSGN